MMQVVEFEKARITERSERTQSVTLEDSMTVLTRTAAAGNSAEIHFYVATEAIALNGAAYPSLVAVWDNEQDAIFDTL